MDILISSALEEICYHGPSGVSLSSLWSTLTPKPSPSVKASLWTNLLSIPSLQFNVPGYDLPFSSDDSKIKRCEDAEKLGLKIVAKEHLRDSFVGLYDTPSTGISSNQRNALKRLAVSRGNGITQNALAKDLKVENNNFFYVVRSLECRGLIVRQPAVVKMKDVSVTTNMLYLYRHAKHLGVQQRFEINEECVGETDIRRGGFEGESSYKVLVRDYLPAIKAICDKLEKANDKVLVISDIKQDLGYSGTKGHRAWRNILHRLKDACVVEEFEAKVDGKVECCLRLLQEFSPNNFEPKTRGCGEDCDNKVPVKFGKMIQQNDQLVELSLDQQIYDLIDAAGSKGVTFREVGKKLGLDKKRNYPRFENMLSMFGMQRQAEIYKRTSEYRVWTAGNSNSNTPIAVLSKSIAVLGDNNISDLNTSNADVPVRSDVDLLEYGNSTLAIYSASSEKLNDEEIDTDVYSVSPEDGKTSHMQLCPGNVPDSLNRPRSTVSNAEIDIESMQMEPYGASSVKTAPTLLMPPHAGPSLTYPHVPLTADSALREKKILEWLQDKIFILKPEIHKWLKSLEDKGTTIDRKTVDRILYKLERQGHCKLQHINVPAVTNCARDRTILVVLHPSVQGFPPELMGEIHDRVRVFEKQSRGEGSSRMKIKGSVPELNSITRTQMHVGSEEKTAKWEAMRANGFVLAKMGRARLLHIFLWNHLSSLPEWNNDLSSGTYSYAYKLFELESVIDAIPIELFLQVAGSAQKYDDMIEKCKRGLRLSDLPIEEYRNLLDSRATNRLSLIIDILRRLKLIRLVRDGHSEDGVKVPHARSRHAMELKPYVEEPLSIVAVSNLRCLDLRPRIRHDFFLLNREAVDEYWKTLEYCYAAAHQIAAKHAFPGSVVPEVSHHRSWASVRIMSSDQRAELLKRIVMDDQSKTLSYKDCEKIAKDLNLTLQQVLRVYYDKHHRRLNRFQGVENASEECQLPQKIHPSSSKKRKKPLGSSPTKRGRADNINAQADRQRLSKLPDAGDQFMVEKDISSSEHDHLPELQDDDHLDILGGPGPSEDEERHSVINHCAFSKIKLTRRSRFPWTDEADRQLVIQYARHRVVLGPKFHRVDWNALPDLPAEPGICSRRMSFLFRQNTKFRPAVMKLCTMLGERYAKHLERTQNRFLNKNDCKGLLRCSVNEGLHGKSSNAVECDEEAGCEEECWDDFKEKSIRIALEDVFHYKQNRMESETVPSNTPKDMSKIGIGKRKDSAQRSRQYHLHQKFSKLLDEGTSVCRQVHKSLAISNAVELLKLVFLSTSTAPELQNLLAETLRRYSEHDLFAAFSYLRVKKILIGGSGGQPFVLSQQFLTRVSKSPFPSNAGKRAAKLSSWLHERERNLVEGGVDLTVDLQCGDIFQLFAQVSSGELSISPCMPVEGVGEAEDLRSLKHKNKGDEFCDCDRGKKLKSLADSELFSRREKGFPGIVVSLHRAAMQTINSLDMLKDGETCRGEIRWNEMLNAGLGQEMSWSSSCHNNGEEIPNFGSTIPTAAWPSMAPWEAMTCYLEYLVPKPYDRNQVNPDVFRTIYAAIQKAGDQGLSMEEIFQVTGENMHIQIIDVLQTFGRVLKVNAYESVRVVDALYRSKYFLTSLAGSRQDLTTHPVTKSLESIDDGHLTLKPENYVVGTSSQREVVMENHDMHKVTILNLPGEFASMNETQNSIAHESQLQDKVISSEQVIDSETSSSEICMPILPWINGDGTINKVVYNGLVRRVLGTVMQNPGITEENIIFHVDVLNPQSCRNLLELMILDKHLTVRKMHQSTSSAPPVLLRTLLGNRFREPKLVYREHFFANSMSAALL
ncbi:hypothetical protein SADUNF_Sadunf03G0039100 [Salix dunnii]|uniref:B-block binding subunit of TFIIIC domain-containing protein n=1 Tax=Salix dunnii TaxID=1413687 RepID=A0A835KH14_9ROSI|nr:hypothetical protein SADUNF_Sadunf03G0039100 [Salix dunnii]